MERKYDKKWPGENKKFLFGHQTYENIFMSCTSGVGIWTAYEALFMKMWANNSIDFYDDWFHNPDFVPQWVPNGGWSAFVKKVDINSGTKLQKKKDGSSG